MPNKSLPEVVGEFRAKLESRLVKELELRTEVEQATGRRRAMALLDLAQHCRQTVTRFITWQQTIGDECHATGRLQEFLDAAPDLSDLWWEEFNQTLEAVRDECVNRRIDALAITTAIAGHGAVRDGHMDLTPEQTRGTWAERVNHARKDMAGYTPHGVMPYVGLDDCFANLRSALEKELAAVRLDERKATRRGRMKTDESEARRAAMLAKLFKHPSMKDDIPALAREAGVNPKTVKRWLADDDKEYQELRAAMPEESE